MNYYYDLKLNFQKDNCLFYEWDKTDHIEIIKRVPIIHISSYNMKIILTNRIMYKDNLPIILFVDKNNAIAIKFDKSGNELERSFLPLEDELDIVEECLNYKDINIHYEVLEPISISNIVRKEIIIKSRIYNEIQKLSSNKNYQKLKYLYMEWFNDNTDDCDVMVKKISKKLNECITDKEINIYKLINLCDRG